MSNQQRQAISSKQFRRRFRQLILMAWIVPPIFGLSFLLFIRMFSFEQMRVILTTPIQPLFDVITLIAAYWFLNRRVEPVVQLLSSNQQSLRESALESMRKFPLYFWGAFLGYLLLAPASVIISAEIYTDFVAQPVDWFRIHLVALIVSIIVGLPIFFMILDLFGRAITGIPLTRPHLTIKTKVFLIGALIPLLIDTTLVQYFWTRTGYFTVETFAMWLILELMAVAGTLLFVRSFGQSLQPLQEFIDAQAGIIDMDITRLQAQSTDELGVITSDIHALAEQLRLQNEVLQIRNQVLAGSTTSDLLEKAFGHILDICDAALASDKSYLLVADVEKNTLVNVAHTSAEYNPDGYRWIPLSNTSLSVLVYKSGQTIAIPDAAHDKRISFEGILEPGVCSVIATPLRLGDNFIGALVSSNHDEIREYSRREVRLIEALAQEAALVVSTLTLHQEHRKAEQRYQELNELAPDSILLIDENGNISESNYAAQELLGESRDTLKNRTIESIFSTCHPTSIMNGMKNMAPGQSDRFLAELVLRREGQPVFVEIHASRILLNGKCMVQAYMRDITSQRHAEETLRDSEQELNAILNSMQDTYYRTDTKGRIIRVSPSVYQLLGYKPEELIRKPLAKFYVESDGRNNFLDVLQRHGGMVKGYEIALRHKNQSIVWVSTNSQYYFDEEGNIAGVEGTSRDMTKIRYTRKELLKEKERAQVTLESIADGVVTTDVSGQIEYLNPVAEQICGWIIEEVENKSFDDIFPFLEETTRQPVESPIIRCLEKRQPISSNVDVVLISKQGREFAVEFSAAPIRDGHSGLIGVVVGIHDVTDMRQMAQQLSHQATHDGLTGLINRREFEERLKQALDSSRRDHVQHALCYLDLDQFKVVNDTCGHIAGDELLKQIASRLRNKVRKADTLARLGGDEFGVLLWDCPLTTAEEVTEGLRKEVKEFRFSWEGKVFEIGVSIGLVPITSGSGNLTDILSSADSACYAAKDKGRNRVHIYQPDDKILAQRYGEMQWVSRISEALEKDQFLLYVQRIKSLRKGTRDRWEILVRLDDGNGNIVLPMAFIPAAERYHVMPMIDRWVLEQAFSFISSHKEEKNVKSHFYNFNLSGQSLSDNDLLKFIIDQIENKRVDPTRICFEVTETAAIADLAHATRFIEVITGLGCHFALDDFGSGLSSFAYLKNLDVSYLKIDGRFVRDMVDDPIDYAMVESINHVGHKLGIKTIAEFVESEKVLKSVKKLGIDFAQGYAIAKPVPWDEDFIDNTRV